MNLDDKEKTMKTPVPPATIPLTAEQLRKKLQLKDGGDLYLFATTAADGSLLLFVCRKIG